MADDNPPEDQKTGEAEQVEVPTADAGPASDEAAEVDLASEAPGDDQALTPEQLDELRANEVAFSWQASEYVHHEKGPGWYMALVAVGALLVAVAAWLHYWLELGALVTAVAAAVVYARKPPRTLQYELTQTGITIDGRPHLYSEFRSFGVVPDTDWHTIDLEPVKRFRPRIAVLFDTEDFEAIVGHLELHLPRIDHEPDIIDQLSQYLRF